MEILQLKYFQMTAKTENISHTAHHYMVPPSSVSISIKKLETELGVKLFDRTANKLKLNPCGKMFSEAVDEAERNIKQAKINMLNLSQTPFGEIKLLILTNRSIVTDYISKFKQEYPHVTFKIRHEDYGDYSAYSDYDVIISDRLINTNDFNSSFYVIEEVFLAVHKKHRLASSNVVTFDDIKKEKIIFMPKGSSLGNYMQSVFKEAGFEPDIAIECDDPHYIREYLNMGLATTFFPSVSWKVHINDNIRLLRVNDGIYRKSYIYTNIKSSNTVKIFAEGLQMINA